MALDILVGPASKDHELELLEQMQTTLENDPQAQLFMWCRIILNLKVKLMS
ncbi:Uncharacterised protein [Weissella viridescens]|uniref:Uncharacterized protein n=1 Tax=Weissella viridescens TaxID=1629 RepID=A0A380P6P6_WEIVI|nr:Uncharacterised protein [Weissella viridescens]